MLDKYITIEQEGTCETIEKKSRFIANVFPIQNIEEADYFLGQIRKRYWDGAHHCYAYQIGEKNEIQRFSDDGEPQGTAGKPILDALKGEDIKNTLIVVTRYFGGTLLGTGGLVRAYGKSAKEGIQAAGLVQRIRVRLIELQMAYPLSGKVQYLLKDKGYKIRESEYMERVIFIVEVPLPDEEIFTKWLIESTHAEVSIIPGAYCLISKIIDK